jgi:chromosome partitioning protein
MRRIMVVNAKGGCGKSTIATSIASYYALAGARVVLADCDPQASSVDWIARRPREAPPIRVLAAYDDGVWQVPADTEYLVMDTPARAHGLELARYLRRSDSIVMPVLPSPIDIQACERFLKEIIPLTGEARIALVANRVRGKTHAFDDLNSFLERQKLAYVATLRDAQNYVRAYSRGLGIYELPKYLAWPDWETFEPLIQWLDSFAPAQSARAG